MPLKRSLILKLILPLYLLLAAQCQGINEPPQPTTIAPTSPIQVAPILTPGDGSDLLDQILERGVLRVGLRVWPSAEYAPPAFRGASNAATGGALTGFEVEIAHLLATNFGVDLELIEAYPPTLHSGDWAGAWDIALASIVPFDQNESQLLYSQPYGYMPMGLLTPAASDTIQTIDHLAGRRVGVLTSSAYETILNTDQPLTWGGNPIHPALPADIQVVPVSNLAKAIDQLAEADTSEAEAIFGPVPILEKAIRSDLPLRLAIPPQAIGIQPLAVAIAPHEQLTVTRLQAEINKILTEAQHQGQLAEIYLKWYGQDLSKVTSP